MKRILLTLATASLLFVFAAPADAGPVRRLIDRFRRDPKPAVTKKVQVDRERKVLRVRPVGCQGGQCPVR